MAKTTWRARLGGCLAVLSAPMLLGATGLTTGFEYRVLQAHNFERAGIGAPPLRWNDDLARSAQIWADYLAVTGRWEHAPENPRQPQGENIWAGTRGYFSPEAMTSAWIREKRYFKVGLFPDNSTTGRVEDVGHYTQLVWRKTTDVGCAMAQDNDEDFLVCRYAMAGNWTGQSPL